MANTEGAIPKSISYETLEDGTPYIGLIGHDVAAAQHDAVVSSMEFAMTAALQGIPHQVTSQHCGPLLAAEGVCTIGPGGMEYRHGDVRPDVAIVQDADALTADGIAGVPLLVAEVVTAESRLEDTTNRLMLYAALGVNEYWVADTMALLLHAYALGDGKRLIFQQSAAPGERLYSKCIPTLSVTAWAGWLDEHHW